MFDRSRIHLVHKKLEEEDKGKTLDWGPHVQPVESCLRLDPRTRGQGGVLPRGLIPAEGGGLILAPLVPLLARLGPE